MRILKAYKLGKMKLGRCCMPTTCTTATLANISSVENVIQILNDFENCSGLKMNLSKTKAMWVGKNKNSLETPLGLEWCIGVKTLGIHFSCDQEQVMKPKFP